MATAPVYTHAFDFYYKWAPTASGVITNISWSIHNSFFDTFENNTEMSRGWYNLGTSTYPWVITRRPSAIIGHTAQGLGAVAWGSAAADFLWNVQVPSMSYVQSNDGIRYNTIYRATYGSQSLLRSERATLNTLGVASYPITSSWIAYEPRLVSRASGSTSGGYIIRGTGSAYLPASYFTTGSDVYSLPTAYTPPTTTYPNIGQNPSTVTYSSNSTGSNDGRFFDLAGGCGITRTSVSASLVAFAASASFSTVAERNFCATQLKSRRLFFPTVSTGSTSTTSPSYWVTNATGRTSAEYFTENGGIYNVKFNLKRDVSNNYYPDTGEDSQLLVFLHNVNAQIPAPNGRIPGAAGWYPPENNIVRIKNSPAMSFINPATGYLIESFNVNVIQYGTPAQLVFEASGSLNSNRYFGCIIDDVEFCKIGVSTDPALIKPTTPGQFIIETQDQFR
jgi:hypothetical protein